MRTIAIKMKSYAGSVNIVNNNNIEKRILNILLVSFGFLAFTYILFLGNMVFNIVERKTMESHARTLSNEVGDLELTYLLMSDKIDLAFSHSLGFTETAVKFATRKPFVSLKITKNEI